LNKAIFLRQTNKFCHIFKDDISRFDEFELAIYCFDNTVVFLGLYGTNDEVGRVRTSKFIAFVVDVDLSIEE
jgi:hypothetical protein